MAVFGENRGLNVRLWVRGPQKAHPCADRVFWRSLFSCQSRCGRIGCRRLEEPSPKWKNSRDKGVRKIAHAHKRNPSFDLHKIIIRINFIYDRLRGFWVAGVQISPFPIGFHRRPYNTLALPCECVMAYFEMRRHAWRHSRGPAKTLTSTLDGIFCSKLATVLEHIAMVQSVRNTRLPSPQYTVGSPACTKRIYHLNVYEKP